MNHAREIAMPSSIVVRPFRFLDREAIRQISCDTALRGEPGTAFFADREILADALTRYFTDFEPESCFVAEEEGQIAGYIMGATNSRRMEKIFPWKIIVPLLGKALYRGTFLHLKNLQFLGSCLAGILRGEMRQPRFDQQFPSILHINLRKDFRGHGLGGKLISAFLAYLRDRKSPGVHLSTMSPQAGRFFEANGFQKLFVGKRSYFRPIIGSDVPILIYGKYLEEKPLKRSTT